MRALLALLLLLPVCVCAQPVLADGGVLNAASFTQGQPIVPGELVSLFGSGLAARLAQGDSLPLSTTIDDVFVTINGVRAPLYFVSPGQINAQVPWEIGTSGTATIIVNRGGVASAAAAVPLSAAAPGLFLLPGGTQAIAVNGDGTIAAAPGSIPGLNTHAAKAGDVLVLYATGLGAVTPDIISGRTSIDQLRRTVNTPVVTIGGVPASVAFSGLAPEFVGVNQLNVTVPAGVSAGGSVPIEIRMDGRTHQASIAITQ
jgi:uncharacterized protein (TIGR03437 family)